jgi:hypothetical protein
MLSYPQVLLLVAAIAVRLLVKKVYWYAKQAAQAAACFAFKNKGVV